MPASVRAGILPVFFSVSPSGALRNYHTSFFPPFQPFFAPFFPPHRRFFVYLGL